MPTILMDGTIPTGLTAFEREQVYNCLDAAITAQLLPVMKAEASNLHLSTYRRRMETQALCFEMSSKGLPVDNTAMVNLVVKLEAEEAKALRVLKKFTDAVGYHGTLNPNSPVQVGAFFYDFLGIPTIWKYDHKTKQRKRATDRDALEKLRDQRPIATPFVLTILAARDARKLAGVFKRGLEPGHPPLLRCGVSPSGTETSRLSSQQNVYGRGTNAQNLNDRSREVVSAPSGYAIVYSDLKTAESYATGYISGDRAYIDACSSGDLHTGVSKLVWPTDLPWTGDLAKDKAIAESPFYRFFSYRDMAKRGGHATNYYGKPRTVATHLKVREELIADFQAKYFGAFPGIPEWHLRVIHDLQIDGTITNPLGAVRRFWGRPNDETTWREAIAHGPQSTVAEIMNNGLVQLMRRVKSDSLQKVIDLRMQVHDAGLFLVPIAELDWAIPYILEHIVYPVDFGPLGVMSIPADAQVGKIWAKAKFDKKTQAWKNPLGLRDWTPGELHFA